MTRLEKPLIVCLHALGSSGRAFQPLQRELADDGVVFAPDLPGFGTAAAMGATSVRDTAGFLAAAIAPQIVGRRWLLVGHSMGGKYAAILAAGAVPVDAALPPPDGVLLLAGSPPSPEPMGEDKRRQMIEWAQGTRISPAHARRFLKDNTAHGLAPAAEALALDDLAGMSTAAWRGWLADGSREDWSAAVGTLDLPAHILVGAEDGDLGESGQRATNMKVYKQAELQVVPEAGHLLPLECPALVAAAVQRLIRRIGPGPCGICL